MLKYKVGDKIQIKKLDYTYSYVHGMMDADFIKPETFKNTYTVRMVKDKTNRDVQLVQVYTCSNLSWWFAIKDVYPYTNVNKIGGEIIE